MNLHTEDVVYNDLTIPKVFRGRLELREFYVRVLEAFPNFNSRYDRFFQQGDVIITEGALLGDQTKPYRGNPPSNKHVECPWVQILHFRRDLICEVHDYYDRLDFLRQMGILNFDFTGQPLAASGGVYKAGPA
ncbi:MAG: ester cyclase [Acidobacteria bacterium]|nr:ester cyclase [Acidobacteriota bacterium]